MKATRGDTTLLFEMKARREEFTSIYDLYELYAVNKLLALNYPDMMITIGNDLDSLLEGSKTLWDSTSFLKPVTSKIKTMHKWVKNADVLVIKDNNRPMLFIKYERT